MRRERIGRSTSLYFALRARFACPNSFLTHLWTREARRKGEAQDGPSQRGLQLIPSPKHHSQTLHTPRHQRDKRQ